MQDVYKRQHIHRTFACAVCNVILRGSDEAFYRGKVQNSAIVSGNHEAFTHCPGHQMQPCYIQPHNLVPGIFVVILGWQQTVHAGAVDKYVQSAKLFLDFIQHAVDLCLLLDITAYGKEFPSCLCGIVGQTGRFFRMASADSYIRTLLQKGQGDGTAQSACSACDQEMCIRDRARS